MRILIAPNAFKGSLSAIEAAEAIALAFREIQPSFTYRLLPVADGGDGTAEVLAAGLNARKKMVVASDPLGRRITIPLYLAGESTAIIELADSAGLRLLSSNEFAPLQTNTYGVGQMIKAALDELCRKIILGIGGSATLDMGVGMLRALGVRFLNEMGKEVTGGGGELHRIVSFDTTEMDLRIRKTEIQVACDVENYLLGSRGAARVFGLQKGATPSQVETLEENHHRFANLIEKKLGQNVTSLLYGGAAGGISAGLKAFCNAKLMSGAELVLDCLNFDRELEYCDVVVTGEGQIDSQSKFGKAPYVVAKRAKKAGKMVIGLTGSYKPFEESPFDAVFSILPGSVSLETAMCNAKFWLYETSKELVKFVCTLQKGHNKV